MNASLTEKQAIDIKSRHRNELFAYPGVAGLDIEFDTQGPVLVIHFDQYAEIPKTLPHELEGLRVDLQRSAPFVAQASC